MQSALRGGYFQKVLPVNDEPRVGINALILCRGKLYTVSAYRPLQGSIKLHKPSIDEANVGAEIQAFNSRLAVVLGKEVKPSLRGELEITAINQMYLNMGQLNVERLGRGFAWLDTGTHESLLEASQFIHTIEERQGFKVACLEEIAYRQGWLTCEQVWEQSQRLSKTRYGEYLASILTFPG